MKPPEEAVAAGEPPRHPELGPALRAARQSKGFSLAKVAAETGISRSLLSLIETGRSDVTVGRLSRLAALYGIRVSDLLPEGPHDDPVVVRRKERQLVHSSDEGLDVHLLVPDTNRKMLPVVGVFEPGGKVGEFMSYEGEEFVLVLEGRLCIEFEGLDPIVLSRGDAVYFRANRPHRWSNVGKGITRSVSVSTPPNW